MNVRPFHYIILFACIGVLLSSCANKVSPTGGKKDITPPKLIGSEPPAGSVNFSGERIVLYFDEFIQLKDVQKQLIVSPPLIPAPRVETRRKSVVIDLGKSLKPATTYSFQFGNSISDLHESNLLQGFQFVVSTGSYIDSAVVSGTIVEALSRMPAKGALAMLYPENTPDTVMLKEPPLWFTRADSSGRFTIRNIRPGTYAAWAVNDKNDNYVADLEEEWVGLTGSPVQVTDSTFIRFFLSPAIAGKLRIKSSSREEPGRLLTVFTRKSPGISYRFLPQVPGTSFSDLKAYTDSVIIWNVPGLPDSAYVEWSESGKVIDTVLYRRPRIGQEQNMAQKISWSVLPQRGGKLSSGSLPEIRFTAPLESFSKEGVTVFRDSVALEVLEFLTDSLKERYRLDAEWKEGNYRVTMLPGTARDIFGRTNDTISFTFNVPSDRTLGSIILNVENPDLEASLLQLVNSKDELIRSLRFSRQYSGSFPGVEPGEYRLRVVDDINGNGRWDAGDFAEKRLPESVIYYSDPVTVRANWEVEINWKLQP